MKTLKSNLKQPIIFAKIIAVSIAIFLCASCDNGNGKRLAKAKNDPAGTYREYLSDIRRQKKLSIKELAGHLKQWQTLRDSVFLHLECDTLGRLHSTVREECEQIHDSIRMEFSRMVLSQTRTYKDILWVKEQISPHLEDKELHRAAKQSDRSLPHWITGPSVRETDNTFLPLIELPLLKRLITVFIVWQT